MAPDANAPQTTRPTRRRKKKATHRPHKPGELGPRVFQRGRWYYCDLRPWDGGRVPLRNPKAPGWPNAGDPTEDGEVAARWAWAYLDALRTHNRAKQLGQRTSTRKTLGDEAKRFLAFRERTAAATTAANSRTALTVHLVPFVGATTPMDTIDGDLMQRWADSMIERGYAVSTVGEYLMVAGAFFRWQSGGTHLPTEDVKLPNPGERDIIPLTDAEVKRARDAADALDHEAPAVAQGRRRRSFRLVLETALGTGTRVAELAALPWEAFDPNEKTVRIRHQAPLVGREAPLQPLKGRRARTALVLPAFWEWYDEEATGCILATDGGAYIGTGTVQDWLEKILQRAKLKTTGRLAHIFRHTYARLFLEMGGRLEELQRSLGHASIKTTEQSYGWLSEEAATTMARSRIYGAEGLTLVKPKKKAAGKR